MARLVGNQLLDGRGEIADVAEGAAMGGLTLDDAKSH
jgi:hypothetical protein